jgi:septum formation protein
MGDTPRIILASASPRRRVLLAGAGLEFEVRPTGVDEDLDPGFAPEQAAETLALRKAQAALLGCGSGECLILGSDTIVAIGEGPSAQQLGKPADAAEALAMLAALSGTRHQVVTGVAVVRSRDKAHVTAHERTWVSMRELSEDEMRTYVDSGEWQDKAGGYAIQETADRFVTGLEGGGWDNVVGLPVALSVELLASLGGPDLADPRSNR